MPLEPGTKLGPYEIISALGAGAMGEVYRARDTRLDRTVAIKVLPESLANDPDRLQRFEQEARVLSALNHPNLLAIYDVGTQTGASGTTHYLVSEFLEGQTLREELESGALPQRKVSDYALKIANGLAAAHEKGIVHRDLKPENIFVTRDDSVKILDFGLAKLSQEPGSPNATNATLTSPALTAAGTVMGTVGYMSPEQVRGQVVDSRSDIFSLGAILYEMATGKRAFKGESGVETMNAILKEDPPELDATQLKVSPGFDRIIRHCLEKNPANRFQSARDLGFAISALSGSGSTATAAVSTIAAAAPQKNRAMFAWLTAATMALIAIVAIAFLLKPHVPSERMEFSIPLGQEISHLAISPDGRMLAFVSPNETSGANMICVQQVGASSVTFLAGTEGASYPFWSPDDSYIGFFANSKLKKVPAAGGMPQIITAATSGRGGAWNKNGVIIFTPQASGWMWRVNSDGTNLAPLTQKLFKNGEEASHRFPIFMHDGDHFLFLCSSFANTATDDGIYLSSLSKSGKILLSAARSSPGFANGQLFYVDGKQVLRSISMDASSGSTSGDSKVIAVQVGYQPSTYWAAFTVAENGTVVFNPNVGAGQSRLNWFDRAGKNLGTVGDVGVEANPAISPDGSRVAVDIVDDKSSSINIWINSLKDNVGSRFTFDTSEDVAATWSRDGSQIAYRATPTNFTEFVVKQSQGMKPGVMILGMSDAGPGIHVEDDAVPNSWTPDDKQILLTFQPGDGGSHLMLVPATGGKLTPFLVNKNNQTNGQISPDGKWVAYASDESGDWEIYVTTFPAAAGKWQVSRGGGSEPRWRGDGKEIFYIGPNSTFNAVPVVATDTFSSGNPTQLFHTQLRAQVSSTDLFSYDVTKDGQRFLVNRYAKPDQILPVHIILNATSAAPQK